jgi:hypothetical protein
LLVLKTIFALVDATCRLRPFGDGECIVASVALCPNERASNAGFWHFCLVQAKDYGMRDFRDAKAMAHTLRASLSDKGIMLTHSGSLEVIAEVFGVADWNTLSRDPGEGSCGS